LKKPRGFVVVPHGKEAEFLAPLPVEKLWGVARGLRKRGLRGRTVKLKLRYADFTTFTRQVTPDAPTDLEQVVFDQAARLLDKAWDQRRKVRLIGVGVSKFEPETQQLSLFERAGEGKAEKLRRLSRAVDRIREKYGDEAIRRGSLGKTSSHNENGGNQ